MSAERAWHAHGQRNAPDSRATPRRPNLRVVATTPTAAESINLLDQEFARAARELLGLMRNDGVTMARHRAAEHQLSCMGLAYCSQTRKLIRQPRP